MHRHAGSASQHADGIAVELVENHLDGFRRHLLYQGHADWSPRDLSGVFSCRDVPALPCRREFAVVGRCLEREKWWPYA
jgi:hypothetical protein